MATNKITSLFNIKYPIIQGGMIWCSGWELASAVSNAGGLGLIGSGSMYPDILEEHIIKCKQVTTKPFGVNVPLLYPQTDEHIEVILRQNVKIVFTSAGNPKKYTAYLKEKGITVVHVIANQKFAQKAIDAGVDGLVAEGFEAGGHNGFEETTTMVLLPLIRSISNLPLIAAGGIASGEAMYATMALGADGVQVGSRFAATMEASGHQQFKEAIIQAKDGSTKLTLKQLVPVRLIRNQFFYQVEKAELSGASTEELAVLLGKGRAKKGMFEGNLEKGELEIGQVSALIDNISTAQNVIDEMILSYSNTKKRMQVEGF